jgi:predicted secreted hydrolase
MKRRQFLASSVALLAARAGAAENYPAVVADRGLQLPRDLGAHPEFRNEWWYITGWAEVANGNPLGVQVTFFRNRPRVAEANTSRFAPRQLLFAHAALSDPAYGRLRHDQRAAREGFGLAHAAEHTTDVSIGDWSLKLIDGGYVARIPAREFGLELHFAPTQPMLAEGDAGFSRKGPLAEQASYYYSQPHLAISGRIAIDGRPSSVGGVAWLDHEWSSEPMPATATGWDWAGINLDDGGALMAFRMRDRSASSLWTSATHRAADGSVRTFEPNAVRFATRRQWRSPRTAIAYPVAMQVAAGDADYVLEPLMDDQEFDSRASTGAIYWEGAVQATQSGRRIGRGYLELTGYSVPLKL